VTEANVSCMSPFPDGGQIGRVSLRSVRVGAIHVHKARVGPSRIVWDGRPRRASFFTGRMNSRLAREPHLLI